MHKKYLKTLVAYLAGVLIWLVLISVLQVRCVLNLPLLIDELWTSQINNELVTNLIGEIAYQVDASDCDGKLIYLARYYPDGVDGEYQHRTLTSMVDASSWQEVSSDSISMTYVDNRYRYVLYSTSDGIQMKVFDK